MATLTLPTQGGDSGTWGTELNTYIKGGGSAHLSETELDVESTGQTTLYTVPTGFRLIIDKIVVIAAESGGLPTAIVTFGEQGSATDFLAAQTFTNIDAVNKVAVLFPVPHASVPVQYLSYPAGSIIEADVTTADVDGGTANLTYVYGTLFAT